MSWYRRVDTRMEGDKRYRALSKPQPNGQSLWQYLLTGPHTVGCAPGLFPMTGAGLAARLRWPEKELLDAFAELEQAWEGHDWPMAVADWEEMVVWIPNAVRYNLPANGNIVKGWVNQVDAIPESEIRTCWEIQAHATLEDERPQYVELFLKQLGKPLPKQFPKRFRTTKPKPKPKPKPKQEAPPDDPAPSDGEALTLEFAGEVELIRPVFVHMPVKTGDEPIYLDEIAEWQTLYGRINVAEKLKHMAGYWGARPKNQRKTARGIRRSIVNWLAGDDHKAPQSGGHGGGNKKHSHRGANEDRFREGMEDDK